MACSNTNITCNKCNTTCSGCNTKCPKCGCKDSFLTTPPPCPSPAGCPDPPACSEVLDSNCVIYSGPGIACGNDTVVVPDTSVMDALEDIVNYFCERLIVQDDILCLQDIVVAEGTLVEDALVDIVDYFCENIHVQNDILCGNDIVVASGTNVTTALEDIVDYFCPTIGQIIPNTSFRAISAPPANINFLSQSLGNSFIGSGDIIKPIVDYEFTNGVATTSQYNPVTGIWTCPITGKYDINYNIYLTSSNITEGWGNTSGLIQAGVTDPTGTSSIYCADITYIGKGLLKTVYMTGTLQGIRINAGTQIVLRVLNFTTQNYVSIYGDNIDWSIRRVG